MTYKHLAFVVSDLIKNIQIKIVNEWKVNEIYKNVGFTNKRNGTLLFSILAT
jgi:hypothetical protein